MPMPVRRSASLGPASPISPSSTPPVRSSLWRAAASSRAHSSPCNSSYPWFSRRSVDNRGLLGDRNAPGAGRAEGGGEVAGVVGEEPVTVPDEQQRGHGVVDGRVREVVVGGCGDGGVGGPQVVSGHEQVEVELSGQR